MNQNTRLPGLLTLLILPPLAVVLCIRFLDQTLARAVWEITSAYPPLTVFFNGLPNLLPAAVLICTAVAWVGLAAGGSARHAPFLRLAAFAVPLAFILKLFLQHAFGRTSVRMWLQEGLPIAFRPFHPVRTGGFPSGHSLVAAALLAALWICYPRMRWLSALLMGGLAAALVATSYHFVSDIVAGIWCGVLLAVCLQRALEAGDGRA